MKNLVIHTDEAPTMSVYIDENAPPQSPSFKVGGVYSTLLGRQDLNYTSPIKAKEIRERDRDPEKDINLYRIHHNQNLKRLKEIELQQIELKEQEIKTKIEHEELLQKIKKQAEKKRKIIRNRTKNISPSSTEEYTQQMDNPIVVETKKVASNPKTCSKPKWALTETENEMAMDKEVDELLDFVDSLQIDDFFENLEMQSKLDIIKDRIETLQKDADDLNRIKKNIELTENEKGETSQINNENKENMPIYTMKEVDTTRKTVKINEDRPSQSQIAHQILNTSENIRNVHSKQSIVSILKNSRREFIKTRMSDGEQTKPEAEFIETGKNMYNEPAIYTVCERLPPLKVRGKLNGHDINNLPYLYRHPGV